MVNLESKAFVAVILFFCIVAVLIVLVVIDFNGWGTALAGIGGPFTAGLYNTVNAIPIWISSGGWPTLGFGIVVFLVIWPLIIGYVFERKHVIATLRGATASTPAYDNTMNVEPAEPERQPQAAA